MENIMHADLASPTPFQAPSRRVEIASGASRAFVLKAGATLVCVSGSVRVEQVAAGAEAAGCLHLPRSVRVNAGEAHGMAEGGAVRVTAIQAADVICVDLPGPIARFLNAMTKIFRRKTAKSANNRLGALHKIS
ncbi:hypothetical protein YH64_002030 [Achromobacter sp. LC458]|nr:hypothetical protein YH64_002030 [Achromobacter sp. LC458]